MKALARLAAFEAQRFIRRSRERDQGHTIADLMARLTEAERRLCVAIWEVDQQAHPGHCALATSRALAIVERREPWPKALIPWKTWKEESWRHCDGDKPPWIDRPKSTRRLPSKAERVARLSRARGRK